MSPESFNRRHLRRTFLGNASLGLGAAALWMLDSKSAPAAGDAPSSRGVLRTLHFPPRIKRVIFLYMSGGPSQFESFDEKPKLKELDGRPMPESFTAGQPIAQLQGQKLVCLAPQFKFNSCGKSGQRISEVFPHISSIADDICIVRSMHTDQINHDPAHTVMNTGSSISGRPSMGSWILYGIGSDAEDLPGFVVLTSTGGRNPQPISNRMWGAGFLEPKFQGIPFQSSGDAVHYLNRPQGVASRQQRDVVDAVRSLNGVHHDGVGDPEIATRISQYELAFKMQMSVPQLMDISDEPQHVLDLYGTKSIDGTFAGNCLLARRMAERGVRFIQVYHRGWDHHNDLVPFMKVCTGHCDQASAALVQDLRQRGMLDETLIIWSGEFGRTPMAQSNKGGAGRDHHMRAFSLWLCGGGIRPGMTYGATDELGYNAVTDRMHVNDLHATILQMLGIDHERLTFRTQGRNFRLTDVAGRVVREIMS